MKATKITWFAFLVFLTAQPLLAQTPSQATQLAAKRPTESYGLPLMFEKNQGQTDSQVQFLSRGNGYSVFLTAGGMVLGLRPEEAASGSNVSTRLPLGPAAVRQMERASRAKKSAAIAIDLVGAASNAIAVGEEPLATKVNYFIGRDPKKWRTNVPAYAKVRYKNVYPGIDLVYYGNNRAVEYDFDLAPGADPTRIQFLVKGADALKIDSEGNLALSKGSSTMRFRAPLIYQSAGAKRTLVPGGYVMRGDTHVGFAVGNHDSSQPLVIDPVLVYSTFLGGSSDDFADGIAVDSAGDAYVVGLTDSADFPGTPILGTLNPSQFTMFLTELDPTGSTMLFLDYFGGTSGTDGATSIALDSSGNAYITGNTASVDFPVLPVSTPFQSSLSGTQDAFVTEFAADGSSILYSTYLGGTQSQIGNSIAVDTAGEAIVTGVTSSTDFPMVSAYQSTVATDQFGDSGQYAFVTKFAAGGTSLTYSTYLAGNLLNTATACTGCFPYSEGMGVATDSSGAAYIVGNTTTDNFPTSTGAYMTAYPGYYLSGVGFVAKFDNAGTLSYSTYLGGATSSYLSAIAVDSGGAAYVTGYDIAGDGYPIVTTAICDPAIDNCSGAIITKIGPTGIGLVYSTFLAAGNNMQGQAIQLDSSRDAIIVGSGSAFTVNNQIENYAGDNDVIVAQIDTTGSTQLFATFLGGSQWESSAQSLALDSSHRVYVTGVTESPDFPAMSGFQNLWGGGNDAFVTKIDLADSLSAVSMGPWALDFGSETDGTPSATQTTILRNMGSAALNIASIAASTDYSETDDCTPAVSSASFCTITVTFNPSVVGTDNGTVTITDDAGNSPQTVVLSGTGLMAGMADVSVSPPNLTFPASTVGTPSAPQAITFTNNSAASVAVSAVQVSGNFSAISNNCGTVPANGRCTVQVGFTPAASGAITGQVKFLDSANGGSQVVSLSGSGMDFTTSTTTASAAVENGGTALYQMNISPSGGAFSSAISFTCNGAPAFTTCSVNPRSVTPGNKPTAVTVTVKTSVGSSQAHGISGTSHGSLAFWLPSQFAIFGVLLFVPRGRRRIKTGLAMTLTLMLLLLVGCAGTSTGKPQSNMTPAGTYQLSVVGASGNLQHVTKLTLTVQ